MIRQVLPHTCEMALDEYIAQMIIHVASVLEDK